MRQARGRSPRSRSDLRQAGGLSHAPRIPFALSRSAQVRSTIPIIYLDNNATTKPSDAAIQASTDALSEHWQNPSSVHRPGQAARQLVELARRDLAELIGARPRDVVITSGGTESIDLAVRGVLDTREPGARRFVTTRIEHAAVRDLAEEFERTGFASVAWASAGRDGVVDLATLDRLIAPGVTLVSVQWANNETGVVQPVERIAALCRARGVLFHCDATQWVGKQPTDVLGLDCDLLTCSAHKFHGPKGAGLLWIRPGVRLRPRLVGSQELGRRGGTEAVQAIAGAGAAAREAVAWLRDPSERERLAGLRDRFERRVLGLAPDAEVNGAGAPRLWNTTNIGFPRLEAEALLLLLSERGVCASAGAACSSGSLDPSPVLLSMGVPSAVAHGSVRFSLSKHTTMDELDEAATIVGACVARLRASLPQ